MVKKGNDLFFDLNQVSLNSDENWPSYKEFIIGGNIIMIHKKKKKNYNKNNQGVFLELLVAANKLTNILT